MKSKFFPYIKVLQPAILRLYFPTFLFLLALAAINLLADIPLSNLTRDPISIGKILPFFGIASNIGVLLWAAAATSSFLSAALFKHWNEPENARFFFFSALITTLLLVDDLFVLHESLRDYLGFPENASYAIYLLLIGAYLIVFRRDLLNKNLAFLVLAFGFLGGSMGIDMVQELVRSDIPGYFLVEDGLKLMGIVSWAGYFVNTAFEEITKFHLGDSRI